jgi:TRAP-type C4-dicarboxylate transport system permease small subunit
MQTLWKVINRINQYASSIAGILAGIICAIVCYGVVIRYVFNRPVGWTEETSSYLMVWAAFLGAAYTLQIEGHIGVDILCKKFSLRTQAWFHIAKYIVGVLFCVILTWKGLESSALSWKLGRTSISELQIPLYIPQMAIPVGAFLLLLQMVEKLIGQIFSLRGDKEPHL